MRSRVDIKQEAKAILRANLLPMLVATALCMVTAEVLGRLSNLLTYGSLAPGLSELEALFQGDAFYSGGSAFEAATELTGRSTPMVFFFNILTSLFMTVLWGGYYIFCMGIKRGMQMPYSSLFDGLALAGKLIWCQILTGLFVFAWSLLFFFPGIIALYRYHFATFNLLDDDSLTVRQAIALSCKQTKGKKLDLFVLDLSFLGWRLLSALTFGILSVWVTPYQTLCNLEYYELSRPRPEAVPHDDPWNN